MEAVLPKFAVIFSRQKKWMVLPELAEIFWTIQKITKLFMEPQKKALVASNAEITFIQIPNSLVMERVFLLKVPIVPLDVSRDSRPDFLALVGFIRITITLNNFTWAT